MDTPIFELPRSFRESVERGRRPQEYGLHPDGKRFDGLSRGAGLSVDFDDVRGVARTVVFGEAGHSTLLQLFDPLDFSLKAVADIDGEPGVFGVEDVPLRAALEGVGVCLDEVLEPVDSSVELAYFGRMVVFSLFDCFEQGFGDTLQGVGVEVGAAIEDVSSRSRRDGVVGESVSRRDRDG